MTTERTPLDDLAQQVRRIRDMESYIPGLVVTARYAGASWSEVGDALGVSKQAAQQRYGVLESKPPA